MRRFWIMFMAVTISLAAMSAGPTRAVSRPMCLTDGSDCYGIDPQLCCGKRCWMYDPGDHRCTTKVPPDDVVGGPS